MAHARPPSSVSDQVSRILENCGVSLFQVSQESARRYRDPLYHIPHRLYSNLRNPGFTPSIHQILAFSSITSYRIIDWLSVFGFPLASIPRLQVILPSRRTHLIDTAVYDDRQWVSWFADNSIERPLPTILPLSRLLSRSGFRKAASFLPVHGSPFLYAKVGWQDDLTYPDLLPESIIRVDTRKNRGPYSASDSSPSNIVLLEHAEGFCFCRLHPRRTGQPAVRPIDLRETHLEWQLGRDARIIGTADVELRPLVEIEPPEIHNAFRYPKTPSPLRQNSARMPLGELLALSRVRAGLSFRAASALTRTVAAELNDKRYFCAPGALSDYETLTRAPRHVHKLITLSIVYALAFFSVLDAAGLEMRHAGQRVMPEFLLPRAHSNQRSKAPPQVPFGQPSFLEDLVHAFEEVPLFLEDSVPAIIGLPQVSLRDVYWINPSHVSLHQYLKTTVLAAINRRRKKPVVLAGKPSWAQPLYLLLTRDNGYVVTSCHLDGNRLVTDPFADGLEHERSFRKGIDAEVVGKVVALLRWVR